MKKILLLLTTLILIFCLASCGEEEETFEPVASTEEESRVVMTLAVADKTYEVRYELYRALFIGNHELVDGGDMSLWTGYSAEASIAKMNEIIADRAAEIYSVLHLASRLGIDPYSSEGDKALRERIKLYVHGGTTDSGTKVVGYGSYEAYLKSLEEKGMNYAVGELMFRYYYALDKVNEKLIASVTTSDEALYEYYKSRDCARVLEAYFQLGTKTEDRVREIRNTIAYASSLGEVASLIIHYTAALPSELIDSDGNIVGKPLGFYELDDYYYLEYTSAAFSLDHGEVSGVIVIDNVNDSYTDGYYVLIGLEKSDDYFEAHKSTIKTSYINNEVGHTMYSAKATLLEGLEYTASYDLIDHFSVLETFENSKENK